jgi:hypothetical protein
MQFAGDPLFTEDGSTDQAKRRPAAPPALLTAFLEKYTNLFGKYPN